MATTPLNFLAEIWEDRFAREGNMNFLSLRLALCLQQGIGLVAYLRFQ